MKVFYMSSEIYPYAKTGGLADVAGTLPLSLKKLGVEIILAMPYYNRFVEKHIPENTGIVLDVEFNGITYKTPIYKKENKDVTTYFIKNDQFFNREFLYGTPEGDYPDNPLRFGFFNVASLRLLEKLNFKPAIIHLNDWQTALVPVYLKKTNLFPFLKDTKTIITIHNLAYQGTFDPKFLKDLMLPESLFNMEAMEFYGKINFLKGGIVFSDVITTVSPTYAREIQTPEYGYGLEGVLYKRREHIYGILNGIDYDVWNPENDENIYYTYSVEDFHYKKMLNKTHLQEDVGLPADSEKPLIGMVSRLAAQKGLDLLADAMKELSNMDLQMVILGTGDKIYQDLLSDFGTKFPDKFAVKIAFDPVLARRIYAGSDMFLMPSRYEPCGLGQMIAMRYGTIPVVRKTGGLADTVEDFTYEKLKRDPGKRKGYGFSFTTYTHANLIDAIKRALKIYRDKETWNQLVKIAMTRDFSWKSSAREYIALYEKVMYM